jgi:hypothetical protein
MILQAEGIPENFGAEFPIVAKAGTGPVMDVAVVGKHAFAIGQGTLYSLDITVPAKPRILGELSGLGSVRQIEVHDGIAYITSRQDGLFIVAVDNPAQAKLLNHYDTVEFATGVALSGKILAVACRNYGVELIDVSDPSQPSHISTVRTGEAQSLVARNGYLYVGVWGSSELVVVDFKNPWQPEITAKLPLDGYGDGVDVEGDYVYVTTGHHSRESPHQKSGDPGFGKGHGLEVFEIKDPAQPKFVSRVKFPPLYIIGNDMWDVTIANGHAFVADTWNGMFIVDVADPQNMKIVGHCKPPTDKEGGKPGFIGGLKVVKGHVLLAGGYSDLHVVPASMAVVPVEEKDEAPAIGTSDQDTKKVRQGWRLYRPQGQVYGVDFLADGRAAVACGSAGVHIVRLWPEIERLAVLPSEGFAMDVSVSGDRLFVAESAGGLSIWDPSADGGDAFKRVGRFQLRNTPIRQVETPGSGDRILIQAGANQFYILDVSDPSKAKQLLKDSRPGLLYGDQMMRGLVESRYAAVHWHVSGVYWYDLKADPLPVYSGDNFGHRIGSKNGLIAFGDKTLATVRGGYVLLDRSERRPLEELEIHKIGTLRENPGVPNIAGQRLYTADRSTGLITVSDISDPRNPKLIEQFETPGNPTRIEIYKGRAVIPDGYHGLMVEGTANGRE